MTPAARRPGSRTPPASSLRPRARFAAGICEQDSGVDAFAEAAARAALRLAGAPCDVALVFAGPGSAEHAGPGLDAVRERLQPRTLVGCAAQGVVGDGREVEAGGVAVWAGSLAGGEAEAFHVRARPREGGGMALTGVPAAGDADAAIVLADPYSFPVEAFLGVLAEHAPGVPVVGGLASAGPGPPALMAGEGGLEDGAVGVLLRGTGVRACVSQGARPVGPEMTVTAAEGNVIHELASLPPLDRLRQAIADLDPHERALAGQGLLLGLVVDPNKPDYGPGDFLVRGIIGAEEESGGLVVGASVRVGQTVRLHVRDAASAHAELATGLEREAALLGRPPSGALVFTCNGRGSAMFGEPHHDARAVESAFPGAAAAGFFCAGEIGPVGGRPFLHGFTATLAVFP